MNKLRKNINKFYKRYNVANSDYSMRLSKSDMYDYNVLMTVYECIWDNLAYYKDNDDVDYKWLCDLYLAVSDQMFVIENDLITRPNYTKVIAIVKLSISVFGTMSVGAFIAVWIEYGFDLMIIVGIALATFLAVCSGIGAYEDIKGE